MRRLASALILGRRPDDAVGPDDARAGGARCGGSEAVQVIDALVGFILDRDVHGSRSRSNVLRAESARDGRRIPHGGTQNAIGGATGKYFIEGGLPMRRRRVGSRKTAVIAAYVILSLAATAHAECAWVLWSGAATPLVGYASRQECGGARNDDHALAQLLSRAYARPQALECRPDSPIIERRSTWTWTLWK